MLLKMQQNHRQNQLLQLLPVIEGALVKLKMLKNDVTAAQVEYSMLLKRLKRESALLKELERKASERKKLRDTTNG